MGKVLNDYAKNEWINEWVKKMCLKFSENLAVWDNK